MSAVSRGRESACRAALAAALGAGHAVLRTGGSALDAVVAAVHVLEDSGLFNAGRGAVQTREGAYELDAAVMEGARGRAGAVAAVSRLKNPVLAALLVLRHSPHVLLCGAGAERFAFGVGAERVGPRYYLRRQAGEPSAAGTVGAVALDRHGDLAAATSTGGLAGKLAGRIGDSPLVGAGTYASNRSVAVSATGDGEALIRAVAAYDIAALVRYRRLGVQAATEEVILKRLPAAGGRGGAIALDRRGRLAIVYGTRRMFRGAIRAEGRPEIAV